jgi:mxaL protein
VTPRWPVAVATLLLVVAAILPPLRLPRATFDYMVTFDVTQSMNVTDVSLGGRAVSRLELARAAMRAALRRLPCGSKVGWSYFADYRSFTLLLPIEVCANYDVLLSALDRIDGRMRWANASNIDKGVYWARRNALSLPDADIVFFTDGQEAPPLPPGRPPMPDLPSSGAEGRRVGGWLIGVGGDRPSPIPKTDEAGVERGYWSADSVIQDPSLPPGTSHEQLSELREAYLKSLATQMGLVYRRLDVESALTAALLEPRFAHRTQAQTDLGWLPALAGLSLLVWRFAPWPRRRPLMR